jgi:hypothetical protein
VLRLSGKEPHGDDLQLLMDSYDDDLTPLDLRNTIRYLQMNNSKDLHDSSRAEKRATAWLDDRTFHRPVLQELSTGHNSPKTPKTSHRVDDVRAADSHPSWSNPPENSSNVRDTKVVGLDTIQGSPYIEHNLASSILNQHGARLPRHYPAPLTADDLYSYLKKRQFDHPRYLDADRRLIYVADPDAIYLSALIRTARAYQKRSVQDNISRYISQDTSIKVSISEGCTEYQLEFHIPYLAMRYRPSKGFLERKEHIHHGWMNIDFLDTKNTDDRPDSICGVYQAQISLTICGTDNSRWTAYCLEDRYFDEDGEIGEDEQTDDHQSDQIARGTFGAEDVIRDPREYFIRVFLVRMCQVHTERVDLVRRIVSGIQDHSWGRFFFSTTRDGIPPQINDTAASGWIEPTVQLLGIILDDIASMNDAWARFTSDTGDGAYFLDTSSNPRMITTFNQLKDVFNQMLDLEKKLRRIAEQCQQRQQTVNLRLASDSKRNAELTVYFISPFAIVSTFFSIPVPVIGFDRNILSFSIAIVLYIVVLQALLFFWGGRFSQLPWWNKVLKRWKALRSIDLGVRRKTEVRTTGLQQKATAECVV